MVVKKDALLRRANIIKNYAISTHVDGPVHAVKFITPFLHFIFVRHFLLVIQVHLFLSIKTQNSKIWT